MKLTVNVIARNAIIAALYIVLTLVTFPISFLGIQFRIAEILVLLCFFRRDYIVGLTLGCLIANLASPLFPWDLLFGTLATFSSCLLICFLKHLAFAAIVPVIINSFVVGFELYFVTQADLWISTLFVCIGELVVLLVGYILFMIFKKKPSFFELIKANRNVDFKW